MGGKGDTEKHDTAKRRWGLTEYWNDGKRGMMEYWNNAMLGEWKDKDREKWKGTRPKVVKVAPVGLACVALAQFLAFTKKSKVIN